jgi:hypothetical protein
VIDRILAVNYCLILSCFAWLAAWAAPKASLAMVTFLGLLGAISVALAVTIALGIL